MFNFKTKKPEPVAVAAPPAPVVADQPRRYLQQDGEENNWFFDMKIGDQTKRIKFTMCWVDRMGNRYFQFVDNKDIPALRHLAGKTAISQSEWGYTKKGLLAHLQKAVENLNGNNLVGGAHEVQTIINRIEQTDPTKALLRLATVYFVSEFERPDIFDADSMVEKLGWMEQDPQSKVFFLNEALIITDALDAISKADTIQYLVTKSLLQSLTNTPT